MGSETPAKKITRSETFSDLLKTRPAARSDRLMLHAIPREGAAQFGILVPKRLAKRAIDRNTLKRLIRHACHQALAGYQGKVLIRLRKPVASVGDSDRALWWKELNQLLKGLSQQRPSQQ